MSYQNRKKSEKWLVNMMTNPSKSIQGQQPYFVRHWVVKISACISKKKTDDRNQWRYLHIKKTQTTNRQMKQITGLNMEPPYHR